MRALLAVGIVLLAGCWPPNCSAKITAAEPYLEIPGFVELEGRQYALEAMLRTNGLPPKTLECWFELTSLDGQPISKNLHFTELAVVRGGAEAWVVEMKVPATRTVAAHCGPEWPADEAYTVVVELAAPGRVRRRVALDVVAYAAGE